MITGAKRVWGIARTIRRTPGIVHINCCVTPCIAAALRNNGKTNVIRATRNVEHCQL